MSYLTRGRLKAGGVLVAVAAVAIVLTASLTSTASAAKSASGVSADQSGEISAFPVPVSVLASHALRAHQNIGASLVASVPNDATAVEATVVLRAGASAASVRIDSSTVYAPAHQTTATSLLIALPGDERLALSGETGSAHVGVSLDGYVAPSAGVAALDSEIGTLQSDVSELQAQVSALQGQIGTSETR